MNELIIALAIGVLTGSGVLRSESVHFRNGAHAGGRRADRGGGVGCQSGGV